MNIFEKILKRKVVSPKKGDSLRLLALNFENSLLQSQPGLNIFDNILEESIDFHPLKKEIDELFKYIELRIERYKAYDSRYSVIASKYKSIKEEYEQKLDDYRSQKFKLYGNISHIMGQAIIYLKQIKELIEKIETESNIKRDIAIVEDRIKNYNGNSITELLSLIEKLSTDKKELLLTSEEFFSWLSDWIINKTNKERCAIISEIPSQLKEKVLPILKVKIEGTLKELFLKDDDRGIYASEESINAIELLSLIENLIVQTNSTYAIKDELYYDLYNWVFNKHLYYMEELYDEMSKPLRVKILKVVRIKMGEYLKEVPDFSNSISWVTSELTYEHRYEMILKGDNKVSLLGNAGDIEKWFTRRKKAMQRINEYLISKNKEDMCTSELESLYESIFMTTLPLPWSHSWKKVEDSKFEILFNKLKENMLEIVKGRIAKCLQEIPSAYEHIESKRKSPDTTDFDLRRGHEESDLENDKQLCQNFTRLNYLEKWFESREKVLK